MLKKELNTLKIDKLELETTVEDLKRTLKLTEKESQVNVFLNLYYFLKILKISSFTLCF